MAMMNSIAKTLFLIAAICLPQHAVAFTHGVASPTFGKSVLNENFGSDLFLNISKSFGSLKAGTGGLPAILNADQYPTGSLTTAYAGNVTLSPGYFGHYTMQWTGTGAFNIVGNGSNLPTIVYSGGAGVFNVTPSNTGSYFGPPTFYNNTSQTTNMNVEFAFGTLVTAVGSNGGNVQFTTVTNGATTFVAGAHVKFFTGISGLGNGPNSDGSWTILSKDSSTQITLANSSSQVGLVSVTGSGGVGAQTEMIVDTTEVGQLVTIQFPSTIPGKPNPTYAMSGFVWCKTSDLADIASGKQVSQVAINFIKALKPKYVRFMDAMATQAGYSNYSQRAPITSLTYSPFRYDPSTVPSPSTSSGTSDNYTINNPSASGSGAYADGEVVQFTADRTSVTNFPTINVGGRGAAPIYANSAAQRLIPLELPITGSTTTGDVISIVFTASYLPSGSYTFTYTVKSADTTISILQGSMAAALAADNVLSGNSFIFGNSGLIQAYYVPTLGALTVTSSTSGAGTETVSPQRLAAGQIAIGKDYTLTYIAILGGFRMAVDNGPAIWSGIPLEVIYEICTRANVGAWFAVPLDYTLSSMQSLGTAVATNMPGLPVAVEYGNEVWNTFETPANQAAVYANAIGFAFGTDGAARLGMYSFYGLRVAQLLPAFATAYVGAGGSRSNVALILENWALDAETGSPSNGEMIPFKWNGGLLSGTPASCQITISGATATFSSCSGAMGPGMAVNYSGAPAGLTIVRSTAAPGNTTQTGNGSYTLSSSPGNIASPIAATITNPVYAAVGGIDGTPTSTSYNAFPTRPIDLVDGVGYAVYFLGALAGQGSATWNGTQSFYNTLFQASDDYATGIATSNPALVTSALNAWSNDVRSGTKNGVTPSNATITSFLVGTGGANVGPIPGMEAAIVPYDGARPSGKANLGVYQYEGGLQQTLAANNINGTSAASATDLSNQFTTNGWTSLDATYGYPGFGAGSSQTAANIVSLFFAYVNSQQYYNDQLYLWQQAAIIHAARPVFAPAQFGIESVANGTIPLWGLVPGDLSQTPLQNYNAEQFYNLN